MVHAAINGRNRIRTIVALRVGTKNHEVTVISVIGLDPQSERHLSITLFHQSFILTRRFRLGPLARSPDNVTYSGTTLLSYHCSPESRAHLA